MVTDKFSIELDGYYCYVIIYGEDKSIMVFPEAGYSQAIDRLGLNLADVVDEEIHRRLRIQT